MSERPLVDTFGLEFLLDITDFGACYFCKIFLAVDDSRSGDFGKLVVLHGIFSQG